MHSGNQIKPIIVAILANTGIAIAKGVGYMFSGSSALLSETIHSVADVMNQALLLLGVKRGGKEETEKYQYGYSQERFFWNLVSAMGIFVLGCGVTLYHGIHDLLNDRVAKTGGKEQLIIEIILIISALLESYSFWVVIKEIQVQAKLRSKKFFEYLKESTDPSVSAIFWEDAAAITGILLALFGIILTDVTGNKIFDAIASIIIGLLMGWIALHLAIENKRFLIDQSIPEFEMNLIHESLRKNSMIESYNDIKTVVLGPDRLKLSARIHLNLKAISEKIAQNEEHKLDKNSDDFTFQYSLIITKQIILELEKIESDLRLALPILKHIDLTL